MKGKQMVRMELTWCEEWIIRPEEEKEFKRKKPGLEEMGSNVVPGNAFEVGADMKGGKEPINYKSLWSSFLITLS